MQRRRKEKELRKEAKRFLKTHKEGKDAPSGASGALTVAQPTVPQQPLSAAQLAMQRVAAMRAAALEEDALLARMGAPSGDYFAFRDTGVAQLDDPDADAEAGEASRVELRGNRKAFNRDQKERLDELVPKATGREALMEKRAGARQSNRDYQAAKDDHMLGSVPGGDGDIMGGGGGDSFGAALARQKARDSKRYTQRFAGRDARLAEVRERHVQAENDKMAQFRDLVGSIGPGAGRMEIPRREY